MGRGRGGGCFCRFWSFVAKWYEKTKNKSGWGLIICKGWVTPKFLKLCTFWCLRFSPGYYLFKICLKWSWLKIVWSQESISLSSEIYFSWKLVLAKLIFVCSNFRDFLSFLANVSKFVTVKCVLFSSPWK